MRKSAATSPLFFAKTNRSAAPPGPSWTSRSSKRISPPRPSPSDPDESRDPDEKAAGRRCDLVPASPGRPPPRSARQRQSLNVTSTPDKLLALKVAGTTRYTDKEILAASGLQLGQNAAEGDFKEAAQRLGESGLFSSVVYSFTSSDTGVETRIPARRYRQEQAVCRRASRILSGSPTRNCTAILERVFHCSSRFAAAQLRNVGGPG